MRGYILKNTRLNVYATAYNPVLNIVSWDADINKSMLFCGLPCLQSKNFVVCLAERATTIVKRKHKKQNPAVKTIISEGYVLKNTLNNIYVTEQDDTYRITGYCADINNSLFFTEKPKYINAPVIACLVERKTQILQYLPTPIKKKIK